MTSEKAILTVLVAFTVLMIGSCIGAAFESQRLKDQCMADGHKEYECEAMLGGGNAQVMPMPVVIPIR